MQVPRTHIGCRLGLLKPFGMLSHLAIRFPATVRVVAGLILLAAAPGIGRLRLRTDGNALVAANAPEVLYDRAIRNRFGIEDNLVVLIRSGHADGIFSPATVKLVRELTAIGVTNDI